MQYTSTKKQLIEEYRRSIRYNIAFATFDAKLGIRFIDGHKQFLLVDYLALTIEKILKFGFIEKMGFFRGVKDCWNFIEQFSKASPDWSSSIYEIDSLVPSGSNLTKLRVWIRN